MNLPSDAPASNDGTSGVLSDTPFQIQGPLRSPAQMLADQTYGGHESVHDEAAAAKLGLAGAPIEGPTHFSQYEPLLASMWGERWFSHGCLSSHFLNMVVEGQEVQATVSVAGPGSTSVRIDSAMADGTPVLTGTASIGPDHPDTALAPRLQRAIESDTGELHILDRLRVGQKGPSGETLTVAFDQHLGDLYPFTLADKLQSITEKLSWFSEEEGSSSPWGAPVVPIEMLSVLAGSGSGGSGFSARQPSVGLFIDLEVRLLGRPVLVGKTYGVEREILALTQSRRTESYWVSTTLVDLENGEPTANVLLHSGVFKESFPGYPS